MEKLKTYFNWSSGKDSALALFHLLQDPTYSVEHLLTSVNAHHNRVSMHGLRRELLMKQLELIDIPFSTIELTEEPTMEEYEQIMQAKMDELQSNGFNHAAFGDIFLEDLREYREKKLLEIGITAHFPLWKRNTSEVLHEFLDLGFKTIVVCAKSELLDESFVGRIIDKEFIKDLPKKVDPCGENGEFHTFCFDAPYFSAPVTFDVGQKVYREYKSPKTDQSNEGNVGFWYCDLLLKN